MALRRLAVLPFLLAAWGAARADPPIADPPGQRLTLPGPERDVLVGEALRRLRSGGPRVAAWGARMAADHRLTECSPEILERLVACDPGDGDPGTFPLRAALLDALLRLDPPLDPWRVLPQAVGHLQDGAVLLLLRHPLRYREALLALFAWDGVGEAAWLALGNVLLATRAPGFPARLLRGLTIHLDVRVWTGPPPRYRAPSGSVCADGYARWPAGFPPVLLHRFASGASDSGAFSAPGPRPVHAYRQVWDEGKLGWGISGRSLDRDVARLEWLAEMAPLPAALAAHVEADLTWGGAAPFVREVVRRRAILEEAWRELSRRLRVRGLLRPGEGADLTPRIVVAVVDHRTTPGGDLPPVPAQDAATH